MNIPQLGHNSLRKGRVSLHHSIYLVTTSTLNREPLFNFQVGSVAARSFENKSLLADATVMCWVLMPDHAHWLIQLGDRYDLGAVINRLKSGSSRAVNRSLCRKGPVWDAAYHDRGIRKEGIYRIARNRPDYKSENRQTSRTNGSRT